MPRVGKTKSVNTTLALIAYVGTPLEQNVATMFHYVDGGNFLGVKKQDGTYKSIALT